MKKLAAIAVLGAVLAAAGCTSGSSSPTPSGTTPPQSSSPVVAPTPSLTAPELPADATAAQVVSALKDDGLPVGSVIVYTKATDKNHLLGQPGSYTSKASFTDTRIKAASVKDSEKGAVDLGGSIETFTEASRAVARAKYIDTVIQNLGGLFAAENDIVVGSTLLRLSGYLSPAQVEQYRSALADLTGEKAILVVKA